MVASLNSRLESGNEEEDDDRLGRIHTHYWPTRRSLAWSQHIDGTAQKGGRSTDGGSTGVGSTSMRLLRTWTRWSISRYLPACRNSGSQSSFSLPSSVQSARQRATSQRPAAQPTPSQTPIRTVAPSRRSPCHQEETNQHASEACST